MRRARFIVALALLLSGGSAHARDILKADQDFSGFHAYHLAAPSSAADPTTAPELHGGHLSLSFPVSQSGLLTDVACGTDGFFPQRSGGTMTCALVPTSSLSGTFPGASVTGSSNTVAWFNGSGALNSLTLAAEFASIAGGTLSLTTNGVTNTKLSQMAATTVKVNATNATANAQDLSCSSGFLGNTSGTSLSCQAVPGASVYADGIATGTTQLASVVATSLAAGTVAYVASVGANFQLTLSSLSTDAITVVAASGKPGYQWVRLSAPNQQFWTIATWHIDPTSGSDEATGTGTGASALKTNAEWSRRMLGAQPASTVTVDIDSDVPDADTITVSGSGTYVFQGSQAVQATQTVSSAQARSAASNLANQITTPSDLSAFVGSFVRVQSTTNYAAIVKAVSSGVARLGELWDTTGSTQAASGGITAAQVIEVVKATKGPLRMIVTGPATVTVNDMTFDGSGTVTFTNGVSSRITLNRTILGGTSFSAINPQSFFMVGGLVRSSGSGTMGPCLLQGTAFTATALSLTGVGGSDIAYAKLRSVFFQGTTISLASAILHVDGDLGQFDLGASKVGVGINNSGAGEQSALHFNSGQHYGGGNDATATVWSVGIATHVSYPTGLAPTMNAGNGVAINGANVAIGSLPVAFNPITGSAVYAIGASATAGFMSQSTTGNQTPRTLTNTDGTVAFTFPDGVGGNPIINTTGLTPAARTVTATAPIAIAGDHAAHDLSANRTWSLDANGVTYPFLQQVSASRLLGNPTGSLANASEISLAARLVFSGTSLDLATIGTGNSCTYCSVTYDSHGLVTSGTTPSIGNNTIVGNSSGGSAAPTAQGIGSGLQFVTGTLGLTSTGVFPGSYTYGSFTVASDGRLTAASNGAAPVPATRTISTTAPMTIDGGSSADLSANRTLAVPVFAGSTAGLVPPSGGSTSLFLTAAGTYAAPAGTGGITSLTGPVTGTGPGATATTINLGAGASVTGALPLGNIAQGGAVTTNVLAWNGSAWAATSASPTYIGSSPIVVSGSVISCPTCGTSSGSVTGVFGTAGQVAVSPSTPNPTVSLVAKGAGAGSYGGNGIAGFALDAFGAVTSVTPATYLTSTGTTPGTYNNLTVAASGLINGASNTSWVPTAGEVMLSGGLSAVPVGDSNFTFDTATHTLTSNHATVLNGSVQYPSAAAGFEVLMGLGATGFQEDVFLASGGAQGLALGGGILSGVAFGASGGSSHLGMAPDPGGTAGTTRFLREDATWANPAETSHVFVYQHFFGQGSFSNTLWLFPGGGNNDTSTDQIEYPAGIPAGHLTWYIFVLRNGISSGTLTFTPTINGAAMTGSAPFDVTSSTAIGTYTVVSNYATGGTSATDTYGLKISGTFTEGSAGGGRMLATLVYTP